MSRYDWDWNRGYDRGFGWSGRSRGYGSDFGDWGEAWGRLSDARFMGRGAGPYWQQGAPREAQGYDRGAYGAGYPAYGGYPGGAQRGMYYGGRGYAAGYDQGRGGYGPWGGYTGGYAGGFAGNYGGGYSGGYSGGYDRSRGSGFGGGGYDQAFARDRFLPEDAYRRHPELDRPQRHPADRWPAGGAAPYAGVMLEDDDEIQRAVQQSLYQDEYLDADNIEVLVDDQVVTLRGEVDDYLEARYAWDDAWEVGGVRGVVNQLTVRTGLPVDEHQSPLPQTSGDQTKGQTQGK